MVALIDLGDMAGRAEAHAYFALLDALRDLLDGEVDFVMVAAVKNRYIARDSERTKQRLYAA